MKQSKLSRALWVAATVFVFAGGLFVARPSAADDAGVTRIKFATLAPKGSAWMKVMERLDRELAKRTSNRVKFQLFAGGVKGDEHTVLQRMKTGSVDAGGFLGPGLAEILPEVRIMELPFLFRNSAEVDYVRDKLQPRFSARFQEKGYVLLGWGEAGFVRVFSNKKIAGPEDFKGVKMWALKDDPVASALAEAYGIQPTYLQLPDVLTALQTNMIDAFYAPPMAAVALQWYTKVQYMSELEIANATGALIMTKKEFDKLSPDDQKALMEESDKAGKQLVGVARAGNERSVEALKKNGMIGIPTMPDKRAEMEAVAAKVRQSLVGKLYDAELLKQVEGYLAEVRAKK